MFLSLRHSDTYGRGETVNNYLHNCITKFEGITDVQTIANVVNQFTQRCSI